MLFKKDVRGDGKQEIFLNGLTFTFFRSHLVESLDGSIRIILIRIARIKIVKNYPCFRILLIIHYTFEFIPINFVLLELKEQVRAF